MRSHERAMGLTCRPCYTRTLLSVTWWRDPRGGTGGSKGARSPPQILHDNCPYDAE